MAAPRIKRDNRMLEILAAARKLLETKGLVGSSVAEIAAQANVSEATVFSYFKTRRELIFRVISDWMEPVIERLETDLSGIPGAPARLTFFVRRHLHELAKAPELHQLIYRELHWDNYYGSKLHRLNQRYTQLVRWIIDEGIRSGEVSPEVDADIARDMVFGTLHHIGWRTFMNDRLLDIDAVSRTIVAQIFGGLVMSSSNSQSKELSAAIARLEALADQLALQRSS